MRIGLMGGSFNPPHEGHRHIALKALQRLGLDAVWCLVSPGNPLKSHADLVDFDLRLERTARVLRHPRVVVTGFEGSLPSRYTVDSLQFLRRRYPGARFVWIMGGDCLASFHRWRRWRSLAGLAPLAVFDRPGWRLRALASPTARALSRARLAETKARRLAVASPPAWAYLGIRLSALSSTGLRRLAQGDGTGETP